MVVIAQPQMTQMEREIDTPHQCFLHVITLQNNFHLLCNMLVCIFNEMGLLFYILSGLIYSPIGESACRIHQIHVRCRTKLGD